MNSGLSTKNAPSPKVVLPYYIYSAFSLVIVSILLLVSGNAITLSFIGPQILGVTHFLVLGWISMVIFGALYQLIPVVMEVKLYSEKLAHFSFWTLGIGNLLLSSSFWFNYTTPKTISITGGVFIVLSILSFVANFFMTAKTSSIKTTQNNFIVSAVGWLLLSVLFGLFILLNNHYQWIIVNPIDILKAHLSIGLIGWFLMLVMGVASILLPMFFIVHHLKKLYIKLSFGLSNIGLVVLIISILMTLPDWLKTMSALLILFGVFFFVRYNYDAYKNRLRKKLDTGMQLSVFSFVLLGASMLCGIMVFWNPDFLVQYYISFNIAFGVNLILGFFTSLILGQMYKTLPFIVWLAKYQDFVGKYKTPLPADIYSNKIAKYHFYTFIVAIVLINLSLFVKNNIIFIGGAAFLLGTAILYSYNTLKIVFHKQDLKPLK